MLYEQNEQKPLGHILTVDSWDPRLTHFRCKLIYDKNTVDKKKTINDLQIGIRGLKLNYLETKDESTHIWRWIWEALKIDPEGRPWLMSYIWGWVSEKRRKIRLLFCNRGDDTLSVLISRRLLEHQVRALALGQSCVIITFIFLSYLILIEYVIQLV